MDRKTAVGVLPETAVGVALPPGAAAPKSAAPPKSAVRGGGGRLVLGDDGGAEVTLTLYRDQDPVGFAVMVPRSRLAFYASQLLAAALQPGKEKPAP